MKHSNPIKFPFHFLFNTVVERSRNAIKQLLIFKLSFLRKQFSSYYFKKRNSIFTVIPAKAGISYLLPKTKKSSVCKILRTQYANKMFNLKPETIMT